MALSDRNIFGPDVPKGSSGDGANVQSQINPVTGCPDPDYEMPTVPTRQSTIGGLDSELSRGRGDVAAYERARAAAGGEKPGGSAGFGLPGEVDSGFSNAADDGYHPVDTVVGQLRDGHADHADTGHGDVFGVVQPGKLVTGDYSHQGQSGDTGSDTSGYGKGIGGDVDKSLVRRDD